jgi:hypothetical protein
MNNPIFNAKIGLAALAILAGGAGLVEMTGRRPIELRDAQYIGYNVEKSDGAVYVCFNDGRGKTSLNSQDRSFNVNQAYHESVTNPNMRFDIRGYHSPLFGNVAKEIRLSKD